MEVESVPSWRWIWYRYVANDLLKLIQDLRNDIADKIGTIIDLQEQICQLKIDVLTERERAKLNNSDGAIAVQVIRERMREGEMISVLNARDLAVKQRMSELEKENRSLQDKLSQRGIRGC